MEGLCATAIHVGVGPCLETHLSNQYAYVPLIIFTSLRRTPPLLMCKGEAYLTARKHLKAQSVVG